MKSMRELRPRKVVTLVKRYIDTFSPQELESIADYIDEKIMTAPMDEPEDAAPEVEVEEHECCGGTEEGCCQNISDNPAWVDLFAAENEATVEQDGDFWLIIKDDKPIFKIDKNGDVTKPKGKKVLENIFEKAE